MNPHFLIRLLSMALWLGAVLHSHADDLPDVSQINVEDARNELVALDEVQREKFCEAVLQSERKDLIELCMVTPMAAGNISRAMIKIPDSPFRRELVLLLLRTPGKRWPDIPGDFNTDKLRIIAVGGVTAYVGQYLPDTPITWEVIGSPERRLKLADAFEAAVARVTAESPAAAQTRTNPRPPRRASSDPGRERARCRAVTNEAGPAFSGAYAGLWIAGGLLLVAAAVWCYNCRGQARRTGHSAMPGDRDT